MRILTILLSLYFSIITSLKNRNKQNNLLEDIRERINRPIGSGLSSREILERGSISNNCIYNFYIKHYQVH